jgi:hypothetical protein
MGRLYITGMRRGKISDYWCQSDYIPATCNALHLKYPGVSACSIGFCSEYGSDAYLYVAIQKRLLYITENNRIDAVKMRFMRTVEGGGGCCQRC